MRATAAVAGAVLAALVAVGCGSAVTDPQRSAQAAMPDLLGASSPSPMRKRHSAADERRKI